MWMFKRINIDKKTEKRISMPGVLMPWILMFAVIGLIAAGIFSYTHIWKDSANKGTMLDFVRIDNGEVLDLTWKLQKKYQNDGNDYSYKILLYDSEQKPKIELTVNPSKDSTLWTCPAVIYDYRESSVTTKTMNLTFVASMDKNGQMHLILDAVDDEAGEILSEAYMAALTEGADAATEIWTEAVAENEAGAAAENATEAAAEIGTEAVSDSAGITVSLGADALNETYSAMRFWLLSGLDLTDEIGRAHV